MQKVLVFGIGNRYKEKEEYIQAHYEIVGYLDNKVSAGSKEFYDCTGLPVYSPEDINQYLKQDELIILMSDQYISMWQQLYKLGIDDKKIIFGIMFSNSIESEEELFKNGRYLSIEEGNIVYYFNSKEKCNINNHKQLIEISREMLRERYRRDYPLIDAIIKMPTQPASRKFGLERGTAIDRYYIEKFLEKNKHLIRGDCLEIAENVYTLRYGKNNVKRSYVLHVEGWGENAIKGDLETGEGIRENEYDCAIITQTLMFTFDIQKVAYNIYRMLKNKGRALITISGISQISRYDAERWGSYYGFHEDAMRRIFEPLFGRENVEVHTYGNVKTAIALLYGLCCEDLTEEDFNVEDRDYPVIISVILNK